MTHVEYHELRESVKQCLSYWVYMENFYHGVSELIGPRIIFPQTKEESRFHVDLSPARMDLPRGFYDLTVRDQELVIFVTHRVFWEDVQNYEKGKDAFFSMVADYICTAVYEAECQRAKERYNRLMEPHGRVFIGTMITVPYYIDDMMIDPSTQSIWKCIKTRIEGEPQLDEWEVAIAFA